MRFRGVTLTDILLAAGLLGLAAVFVGPYLRVRSVLRSEDRVAEQVVALADALERHREAGTDDTDEDGVGEYPFLDAVLDHLPDARPTEREGVWISEGYHYAVLLPGVDRTPVLPGAARVPPDLAEVAFVLVAWPVDYGADGMRAYAYRPADGLLLHAIDGYPYTDRPPLIDGVWIERTEDGWRDRPYKATGRRRAWVSPQSRRTP